MKPLDDILDAAKRNPKRIVLPEGDDARIVEAAVRVAADGLAVPILLGRPAAVSKLIADAGGDPEAIEIIDPELSDKASAYADEYYNLRKLKGVTPQGAKEAVANPLAFAAMMVRLGDADGTVGGAVNTTGDVVRAALQVIGRAEGVTTVSSFFLMMLCEHHHTKKGGFIFADCGLVVQPTTQELAEIALSSAESCQHLMREEPRVAFLSFSTSGSAKHDNVSHVVSASDLVQEARPDMVVDKDLQFDAAFEPAVSAAKAPESKTKGAANVFIFPDLDAANIGYKIAQRIGGAKAIGPVLQGLAKPANDLSRGCSVDDIYHLIAVTGVQAD